MNRIGHFEARETDEREIKLTNGTLVSSGVVHIVVTHGLRSAHLLLQHHQLHLLLLIHLVLLLLSSVRVFTLRAGWVLVSKLITLVIVIRASAQVHTLILEHGSHLGILELALLLIGLNGNISVH